MSNEKPRGDPYEAMVVEWRRIYEQARADYTRYTKNGKEHRFLNLGEPKLDEEEARLYIALLEDPERIDEASAGKSPHSFEGVFRNRKSRLNVYEAIPGDPWVLALLVDDLRLSTRHRIEAWMTLVKSRRWLVNIHTCDRRRARNSAYALKHRYGQPSWFKLNGKVQAFKGGWFANLLARETMDIGVAILTDNPSVTGRDFHEELHRSLADLFEFDKPGHGEFEDRWERREGILESSRNGHLKFLGEARQYNLEPEADVQEWIDEELARVYAQSGTEVKYPQLVGGKPGSWNTPELFEEHHAEFTELESTFEVVRWFNSITSHVTDEERRWLGWTHRFTKAERACELKKKFSDPEARERERDRRRQAAHRGKRKILRAIEAHLSDWLRYRHWLKQVEDICEPDVRAMALRKLRSRKLSTVT